MPSTNLAIIYRNELAGLSVTATDEDSAYPADKATVATLFPGYHSASGTTTVNLDVDMGAGTLETQGFANIRMEGLQTSAATIQWIIDNDSGYGSATIDSTALSIDETYSRPLDWRPFGGYNYAYVHSSSSAHRYYRCSIVNTGGADVRVGVLWAGPVWTPTKSYVSRRWGVNNGRRQVTMTWKELTPAEAKEILDIQMYLRGNQRVVVIPQKGVEASYLSEVMLATMDPVSETAQDMSTTEPRSMVLSFTEVSF